MPEEPSQNSIVQEWVRKAENDLISAIHLLTLQENCPTDSICFHAQQCVEKYLKALLTFESIDFTKTHDIARLMGLMPKDVEINLSDDQQALLTDYATTARYPGDYEPIELEEAKAAVETARAIRDAVRQILPPDIL